MSKIVPHFWFDTQAKAAAEFYAKTFPNSKLLTAKVLHDTPSGDAEVVTMLICGQEFQMISAGPYFKINQSISFLVACSEASEVELLWSRLKPEGTVMMDLGEYPFSPKYGWIQDKFGVSWQIIHQTDRPVTQKITPTLMFVDQVYGQAQAAIEFYTSVFHNSQIGDITRYEVGEDPDKPGTVKHGEFVLEGERFAAMESARSHDFAFNEAISLIVKCQDQAEIDHYWNALSADPAAEQCGWLKDKFGVSWQVVPEVLETLMNHEDPAVSDRVTQAFLKMKKFDIAALEAAAQTS